MAQRRDRGVGLIANTTATARRCSRPEPPTAVARSASLEQRCAAADDRREDRRLTSDTVAGFCVRCGAEAEGVEPDARNYECEACGENGVFDADELLIMTV